MPDKATMQGGFGSRQAQPPTSFVRFAVAPDAWHASWMDARPVPAPHVAASAPNDTTRLRPPALAA